jgi:hypothetical protein
LPELPLSIPSILPLRDLELIGGDPTSSLRFPDLYLYWDEVYESTMVDVMRTAICGFWL